MSDVKDMDEQKNVFSRITHSKIQDHNKSDELDSVSSSIYNILPGPFWGDAKDTEIVSEKKSEDAPDGSESGGPEEKGEKPESAGEDENEGDEVGDGEDENEDESEDESEGDEVGSNPETELPTSLFNLSFTNKNYIVFVNDTPYCYSSDLEEARKVMRFVAVGFFKDYPEHNTYLDLVTANCVDVIGQNKFCIISQTQILQRVTIKSVPKIEF